VTTPWPKYRPTDTGAYISVHEIKAGDPAIRDFLQAVNMDRSRAVHVPYGAPDHPHPDSIPGLLAAASARMARENGAEA